MPHAAGQFDVKLVPRPAQSDDEPTIGRLLLDKQYHGDLSGPSKGDMLANQTASTGAAVYVAVERFEGSLQGRTGSFVLAHVGTATRDAQKLTVIIVPGSGTDQLIGIVGTMAITIVDKKHLYEIDYALSRVTEAREMSLPQIEQLVPRRIVVGANAHAELSKMLIAACPSIEVRGYKYTEVTAADLDWGDTYIGFRRPPLPSMGSIRWVHCTGAGVDSWLYPTELPRDILLTRTAESFGPMIAEWALARALAFSQELQDLTAKQREHQWAPRDVKMIRGTTAIVVGTGDVGTHTAKLFSALGCRVVGVSRSGRADPTVFVEAHPVAALRDVVPLADWLILALPHTAETRGLISRDVLALCRGAVLINAGRGIVVDEAAFPDALDRGWLRGAALDVFEVEPLPATSPLWDHPRVMISPHSSGPTTIDGAVSDSWSAWRRSSEACGRRVRSIASDNTDTVV